MFTKTVVIIKGNGEIIFVMVLGNSIGPLSTEDPRIGMRANGLKGSAMVQESFSSSRRWTGRLWFSISNGKRTNSINTIRAFKTLP